MGGTVPCRSLVRPAGIPDSALLQPISPPLLLEISRSLGQTLRSISQCSPLILTPFVRLWSTFNNHQQISLCVRREEKILITSFNTILSYLLILTTAFPYRASNDEATPALDIHHLLNEGSILGVFEYSNGSAYQTGTTVILRLTGLEYIDTSWLSPIIGSFVLVFTLAMTRSVYNTVTDGGSTFAFAAIIPSIIVFPGYISRVRQTTHKGYSFTMIFLLLFITTVLVYRSNERSRWSVLAAVPILAFPFFNFYWAIIYTSIILISMIAAQKEFLQGSRLLLTLHLVAYIVIYYLPTTLFRPGSLQNRLFGGITQTARTVQLAGPNESLNAADVTVGLISQWPTVTVGGISFSIWFVYTTGILFVGTLTAMSALICTLQMIKRRTPKFGYQFISFILLFLLLMGFLFAIGDMSTFKRVIIFPGLVGCLYWAIIFSGDKISYPRALNLPQEHRKKILAMTFAILLITSALAVPRITLDGNNKPLDKYAQDTQLEKLRWYAKYSSGSIYVTESLDRPFAQRVVGERVSVWRGSEHNIIYANGVKGTLVYNRTS